MKIKRFPIFLDADNDAGGAPPAAPAAVPASESPTGQDIPSAPAREPGKVTQITPDAPVVVKQKGILNVRDALKLKEKPSVELAREAKEIGKKADSSLIVPVPKAKKKEAEPTAEEAAAKKAEDDKKAADEAAAAALKEAPTLPVAKVKIGDKEMTAEEVAKYVAELEAKAKPPEAPKAPEAPKVPEVKLTPEQQAAEDKRLDDEFVKAQSASYEMPEKNLEILLTGGAPAVKLFAQIRAQDALNTRKWVEAVVNPILADLQSSIDPVVKMHQEVAQYQDEATFFARPENADLKPQQKLVRNIVAGLQRAYPKEFAAMTPEQRHAEIATHARHFIKENGIAAPTPAAPAASPNATVTPPAAPATPPTPKPPQPKPPTGQVTVQGGAPAAQGTQASMIARLEAARR